MRYILAVFVMMVGWCAAVTYDAIKQAVISDEALPTAIEVVEGKDKEDGKTSVQYGEAQSKIIYDSLVAAKEREAKRYEIQAYLNERYPGCTVALSDEDNFVIEGVK